MDCLDSCGLEHCSNLQFDSSESSILSWWRQALWLYERFAAMVIFENISIQILQSICQVSIDYFIY